MSGRAFRGLGALSFLVAQLLAPPDPAGADSLAQGKKVYKTYCLECHGKQGGGDGDKALRLGFRARDFSLGSFKCRCTPTGALPTDEDLLRVVANGLPGTPMRGYADRLSAAETVAVVEYVKSLAPGFDEPRAECIEIPEPPPATPEALFEGRQVYRLLRCWNCHGLEGRGDGPAAKTLVDDFGDPIKVYNFTRPKRFKCGGEPRDLYRLLHTGVNGSPMPSYSAALGFSADAAGDPAALGGLLGEEAVAELAAYVAGQPTDARMKEMSEAERREVAERRTWSLIRYLETLIEDPRRP